MSRHSRHAGPTVFLVVEIRKLTPNSREVTMIRKAIHDLTAKNDWLVSDTPFRAYGGPTDDATFNAQAFRTIDRIVSTMREFVTSSKPRTEGRRKKTRPDQ